MSEDSTAPPSTFHNPREAYDWSRISSELDKTGLSPSEFRIYCHLLRRADKEHTTWPGIRFIAENCHMSKNTVCVALQRLHKFGFIQIEKTISGSRYTVSKQSEWKPVPKEVTRVPKRVIRQGVTQIGTVPKEVTGCPKTSNAGVPKQVTPTPLSSPLTLSPLISPPLEGNPEKVIQEGNPFFSSPSSKTPPTKKRESIMPDRFASEDEVIKFVFSDITCRELQCLSMDARWFWNCMIEQSWHRDSKEKHPIKDVKATCRKWMTFESRPSFKTFRYKNEDHREQWRQECRLNRDQIQTEML
jgi:predicted transcriptional regulator